MKVLWEKPDTWECPSCNGRHFKVVKISEYWIDYECLMCHQEDAMLKIDFEEFIKKECKNE